MLTDVVYHWNALYVDDLTIFEQNKSCEKKFNSLSFTIDYPGKIYYSIHVKHVCPLEVIFS